MLHGGVRLELHARLVHLANARLMLPNGWVVGGLVRLHLVKARVVSRQLEHLEMLH